MGASTNALQEASSSTRVPPGFRFHPTDEELVSYYLRKKVNMETFDLDVIRDVDLNKLEPWDLDERCRIDTAPQSEWYFFSHKDKKYPTGTRTNRATAAGFWKATGRDKAVHSTSSPSSISSTSSAHPPPHSNHHHHHHHHRGGGGHIGMRKTLVFYCGRAPHGKKTNWIMHEYRLISPHDHHHLHSSSSTESSYPPPQEDGWVVCRVFKKRMHHQKPTSQSNRSTATLSLEEDQSSLITTNPNFEENNNFQVQNAFTIAMNSNEQKFICKLEKLDCENDIPKLPFMHMPQLESLENNMSNNVSQQDLDYYTKKPLSTVNGPSYCKKPEIFPSSLSLIDMPMLDMPTSTNYTRSLIFDSDDNVVENDQWGMLENLPRDISSYHIPSSDLCSTLFSNNCDADIWKPLL